MLSMRGDRDELRQRRACARSAMRKPMPDAEPLVLKRAPTDPSACCCPPVSRVRARRRARAGRHDADVARQHRRPRRSEQAVARRLRAGAARLRHRRRRFPAVLPDARRPRARRLLHREARPSVRAALDTLGALLLALAAAVFTWRTGRRRARASRSQRPDDDPGDPDLVGSGADGAFASLSSPPPASTPPGSTGAARHARAPSRGCRKRGGTPMSGVEFGFLMFGAMLVLLAHSRPDRDRDAGDRSRPATSRSPAGRRCSTTSRPSRTRASPCTTCR